MDVDLELHFGHLNYLIITGLMVIIVISYSLHKVFPHFEHLICCHRLDSSYTLEPKKKLLH